MAQEKLKTMLMPNFRVTNKEHYGMLWYFLEWSIRFSIAYSNLKVMKKNKENTYRK